MFLRVEGVEGVEGGEESPLGLLKENKNTSGVISGSMGNYTLHDGKEML